MCDADVIVVGGGIVGLWTACQLVTQHKAKTILFEQFNYLNDRGSSRGKSRIFKSSFPTEGYVSLASESYKKWVDLNQSTKGDVLEPMGYLDMIDTKESSAFCELQINNLRKCGIEHDIIPCNDVAKQFPGLYMNSEYKCIYEPKGLFLKVENCLTALMNLFEKHGGVLYDCEGVVSIRPTGNEIVEVKTVKKLYTCKSVVLACGSYVNKLLSSVDLKIPVTPTRAFVFYWKDKSKHDYSLKNGSPSMRVYVNSHTYLYSVPAYEYPDLVKIAYHGGSAIDPSEQNLVTQEQEKKEETSLQWLKNKIKLHFPNVDATRPAKKEACMITQSPDKICILDFHPKHRNIVFGAGFSGVGFMLSPGVGRILASMATGTSSVKEYRQFSMQRFNKSHL